MLNKASQKVYMKVKNFIKFIDIAYKYMNLSFLSLIKKEILKIIKKKIVILHKFLICKLGIMNISSNLRLDREVY